MGRVSRADPGIIERGGGGGGAKIKGVAFLAHFSYNSVTSITTKFHQGLIIAWINVIFVTPSLACTRLIIVRRFIE